MQHKIETEKTDIYTVKIIHNKTHNIKILMNVCKKTRRSIYVPNFTVMYTKIKITGYKPPTFHRQN